MFLILLNKALSNPARRRSIRGKLTALVLASVGLAVLLVAGVSALRDGQRDTALATDRIAGTAKVLASLSSEAAAGGDRARAYAVIRSIGMMPDVQYARIERADGSLLAETGAAVRLTRDLSASGGRQAFSLSMLSSRTAQVAEPIVYARRPVGRVVVLGRIDGGASRLVLSLLTTLAAALVAAIAGRAVAQRLPRSVSGPITALF